MVPGATSTPGGDGGQTPVQVAGFAIAEEIGRGGMGIVYRAFDPRLGREVALKRPKPEYMLRHDFASRFLREARTASRLMHPNITTVFAAFEEDGVPWLAMELVAGGSIRQRLSNGQPLPIHEVITHAEGLTDALRVAHANGILHADINPNNILLGRDGRARLTDFGLARARNAPGEPPVFDDADIPTWSSPDVAGTHGYMAPEHVRTGRIDERSDIFCLGLVLSEMTTGRSVFAGQRTGEWIGAVVEGEAQRLARPGRDAPPELARIIAQATATKPKDRYQSAAEMLEDVRSLRRYSESGIEMAIADAARARTHTWYGVLAATGAVVVAVVAAVLIWGSKGPPGLRSRPLTSAPGLESHPALSPDGTLVAYSSNETGNHEIVAMQIASRKTLRLTDDPADDDDPAWFPDGTSLAFVSRRGSETGIWKVPAVGGPPVLLMGNAVDPAVSPDGALIAYAVPDASGLFRIAVSPLAELSARRVLTTGATGYWDHRNPAWSPDGGQICFEDLRDLWVVPAQGGPVTAVTQDHASSREPAWSADGRSIFFSSPRDGRFALWRVRADGRDPVRLTQGTGSEVQPVLSRDGHRMAYATRNEDPDVEVRETVPPFRSWRIGSTAQDGMPAFAPDGSSVAFCSNRLGSHDLWLQRLGAAGPEGSPRRLTDLPGTAAVPAFSRDGRWIAFHRVIEGTRGIWIMPAGGGTPVQLAGGVGSDIQPAFSPDGTRLAFVSDRDGGQNVWVVALAHGRMAGKPERLTSGEGSEFCPAWSPDGRRIAFVRQLGPDSEAWVVGAKAGGDLRRVLHGVRVDSLRWPPDAGELLVAGLWENRVVEVRRVSLTDGSSRSLEPPVLIGESGDAGPFDISADGRLLAAQVITATGDVWLADWTR